MTDVPLSIVPDHRDHRPGSRSGELNEGAGFVPHRDLNVFCPVRRSVIARSLDNPLPRASLRPTTDNAKKEHGMTEQQPAEDAASEVAPAEDPRHTPIIDARLAD